jgi:LPXTG-motif cell wall-anchored protein
MKKLSLVLAFFLILTATLTTVFTVNAAGSISTNKTQYAVGEEIKVTATGTNKDWVGLYKAEEVPGADNISIFWFYCNSDSVKPGDTVVLNQLKFCSGREGFTTETLPAGEYKICLLENDGYNVLKTINITVSASGSLSTSSASNSSKSPTTDGTKSSTNPETGDMKTVYYFAAVALLGSAVSLFLIRNRRRKIKD